jgi:hypothetical protein
MKLPPAFIVEEKTELTRAILITWSRKTCDLDLAPMSDPHTSTARRPEHECWNSALLRWRGLSLSGLSEQFQPMDNVL